jgi:hypothetical protein
MRGRCVSVVLGGVAVWVLSACIGGPATLPDGGGGPSRAASFVGHWNSTFGPVGLTAVGDYVFGHYANSGGRVEGMVSGSRLTGSWSQSPSYAGSDDAGRVVLDLSATGMKITGTWGRGTSSTNGSDLLNGNRWDMDRADSTPASSSVVDGAEASSGQPAELSGLSVAVTDGGSGTASVQVTNEEMLFRISVFTPPPSRPTEKLVGPIMPTPGLPLSPETVSVPLDSAGVGRVICYRHAAAGALTAGRTSFVCIRGSGGGSDCTGGYVPQAGVYLPPLGFFAGTSTTIDFDRTPSGEAIAPGTAVRDQYAPWGVRFSVAGGADTRFLRAGVWGTDYITAPNALQSGHESSLSDNRPVTVTISFDSAAFSQLPTAAGLVFTDSAPHNPFTLRAYGPGGELVGQVTIDTADTNWQSVGHAEDAFIGVKGCPAISRLEYTTQMMQNAGIYGVEVDNVQFSPPADRP